MGAQFVNTRSRDSERQSQLVLTQMRRDVKQSEFDGAVKKLFKSSRSRVVKGVPLILCDVRMLERYSTSSLRRMPVWDTSLSSVILTQNRKEKVEG